MNAELRQRVAAQVAANRLTVDYYRIGYRLAFPLPIVDKPTDFPTVPGIEPYPWFIWLAWSLEERLTTLAAGTDTDADVATAPDDRAVADAAARALHDDLMGLCRWPDYRDVGNVVHLVTAHVAGPFAQALGGRSPLHHALAGSWSDADQRALRAAAQRLIDLDLWPWYEANWGSIGDRPLSDPELQNIRLIILIRGAQLARVLGHSVANGLAIMARRAVTTWITRYQGASAQTRRTEGVAYDGYVLEAVTEWADGPDGDDEVRERLWPVLRLFSQHCCSLMLPGRPSELAPLGDVEPQMRSWMTVLARLPRWHPLCEGNNDGDRLERAYRPADAGGAEQRDEIGEMHGQDGLDVWERLRQIPLSELPAKALVELLKFTGTCEQRHPRQSAGSTGRPGGGDDRGAGSREDGKTLWACRNPDSVVLRTGWSDSGCLVAIGANGGSEHHQHRDGGSLILGWRGKQFISDPGYQQYRPGAEREFTLGIAAHNQPVLEGHALISRNAGVAQAPLPLPSPLPLSSPSPLPLSPPPAQPAASRCADSARIQGVALDLTPCYANLEPDGRVRRLIWLMCDEDGVLVAVGNEWSGCALSGCRVQTSWQGGVGLTWSFEQGLARESDSSTDPDRSGGEAALWIATRPGGLRPAMLYRHPGSRGQLALVFHETLAPHPGLEGPTTGAPVWRRWWLFRPATGVGQRPPLRLVNEWFTQLERLLGPASPPGGAKA